MKVVKFKAELIKKKITDCNGDQKKLFKVIDSLLGRKKQQVLPEYSCALSLASVINTFFLDKISMIRADFPLLEPTLKPYSGAPNSAKFRGGGRGPSKIRQRGGCNIFFTFYALKIEPFRAFTLSD